MIFLNLVTKIQNDSMQGLLHLKACVLTFMLFNQVQRQWTLVCSLMLVELAEFSKIIDSAS